MRPLPESGRPLIGAYRALAELGEGAMGTVFLARAPGGELLAVKRIHPHLLADPEFRARFRREVAASRRVDSAWAVPVIDADTEAAEPWFASAFVPGPTLAEVLAAGERLPEPAVLRLAAGLAAALVDFAAAGVVHRDLKPSNILLAADGPRVLDFGIARAAERADGTGLTRTGWVLGTPAYMSPEQARAKPVTAASDVFSVGSVLVAAHTGSGPFDDPETLQAMFNVVHAEAEVAGLPPRLRRIVSRCLAKQPRQRPDAAGLVRLVGEPPPAESPWPSGVLALLAESVGELARWRDRPPERTTLLDTGPTLSRAVAATVAEPSEPDGPSRVDAAAPADVPEPVAVAPPDAAEPDAEPPTGAGGAEASTVAGPSEPETPAAAGPVAAETEPDDTKPTEPPAAVERPESSAAEPSETEPRAPGPSRTAARRFRLRIVGAGVVAVAAVVAGLLVFGDGDRSAPSGSKDTGGSEGTALDDVEFADAYRDYEPEEPDGSDSDANEAAVARLPDPCSRVGDETVDEFGLTGGDGDTRDVWKSCSWLAEAAAEPAVVNLSFAIAPYTEDGGGETATVTGVEGATLHRAEDPASCTVQWPTSFGYILVTGAGDEDSASLDACGLAVDFAEAAAPDLPR